MVVTSSQAWTLALLGRCHLVAGEAVTAEGLMRAALDGLQNARENDSNTAVGGRGMVPGTLVFPSPLHIFSQANSLRAYSELLMQWEKREAEGERVALQAERVSVRCGHGIASRCVRFNPRTVSDRRVGLTFLQCPLFSACIVASVMLDAVDPICMSVLIRLVPDKKATWRRILAVIPSICHTHSNIM